MTGGDFVMGDGGAPSRTGIRIGDPAITAAPSQHAKIVGTKFDDGLYCIDINGGACAVIGCSFEGPLSTAIRIQKPIANVMSGSRNIIQGCLFGTVTTAVNIGADCTHNIIKDNVYISVTNRLVDAGTNTVFAPLAEEETFTFGIEGALSVRTGKGRLRMRHAGEVVAIWATVNTAPTGAAILIDVNKNGTTLFTTQGNRPTIATSAFATAADVTNMNVVDYVAGDYLTVDIDQIGSTIAGSDLTVHVMVRRRQV